MGTSVQLRVSNSLGAATIGLLFLGPDAARIPTTWGGDLLVASVLPPALVRLPLDEFGMYLQIPNDPAYCGLFLYWQALELDPGAARGVSFSPGLEIVLGR
jgi:hypothetical protein